MADQWFGQNWVVGKKDGRPLYMNVITGEMTHTPPPTNLSAVAARMSAVSQVNGAEPMDCENEHSAHATSSSYRDAPNRKKKRLTCDIDAPAQIPIPRAQYIKGYFAPPPIALSNNRSISNTAPSDISRSTSNTSPLFKVTVTKRIANTHHQPPTCLVFCVDNICHPPFLLIRYAPTDCNYTVLIRVILDFLSLVVALFPRRMNF